MKTIFLLAALIAYGLSEVQGNFMKSRKGRNLDRSKIFPADYITYACYCGQRGKGAPKDNIDRCCWKRECCFAKLENLCKFTEAEHRYRNVLGAALCGTGTYCDENICECDYLLELCVLENIESYNVKYRNFTYFQCTGRRPKC